MQIGNTIVNTPHDIFPEYDAAWRHQVAKAVVEAGSNMLLPDHLVQDRWILAHIAFYMSNKPDGIYDKDTQMHKMALQWHENGGISSIKLQIEALLLTEASFDIIAKDVTGGQFGPEIIQLYERLFYDCRNEDGTISSIPSRRRWLSRPRETAELTATTSDDIFWKTMASEFGYAMLVQHWRLAGCYGPKLTTAADIECTRSVINTLLLERVMRRAIGNQDLTFAQRNIIDHDRLVADQKEEGGVDHMSYLVTMKLLEAAAPRLIERKLTAEQRKANDEAYKRRLNVQRNTSKQSIPDAGMQVSQEQLWSEFQSKVSGYSPKGLPPKATGGKK